MRELRRWRSLATTLAYFNVAWNLLLFAVNPAWGSMVLAWLWLLTGACLTGSAVIAKRRDRATALRHEFLMRPRPRLSDPFRSVSAAALNYSNAAREHMPVRHGELRRSFILEPDEHVVSLAHGLQRLETSRGTRYVRECSHWPRDEVKLSDGTTAAYICRRCGHDWVNEDYVRQGVEW